MHRHNLLRLLRSYNERYDDESKTVEKFIDFVESNPNCFDRSLSVGHVTGSAWLVNCDRTKVLLSLHRKLNKWLQLGGHADGKPNILEVALREAREESGIQQLHPISNEIFDIDIHLIPQTGTENTHYHYDVRFAMQVVRSEEFKVTTESYSLSWVVIEELDRVTKENSVLRMGGKWLSHKYV